MTSTFTFDLFRSGEMAGSIKLSFVREGQTSFLTVDEGPLAGQQFEGYNDFNSFNKLRDLLAADGLFPACKGALLYVWPSGMSADMSFGRVAYMLKDRDETRPPPTVNVFDPLEASDNLSDLATPEAQLEYRRCLFGKLANN